MGRSAAPGPAPRARPTLPGRSARRAPERPRFAVDAEQTVFDTIPNGIQAIYINSMTNDTIIVYGEVINETIITYDKTTYNYFHLDVGKGVVQFDNFSILTQHGHKHHLL